MGGVSSCPLSTAGMGRGRPEWKAPTLFQNSSGSQVPTRSWHRAGARRDARVAAAAPLVAMQRLTPTALGVCQAPSLAPGLGNGWAGQSGEGWYQGRFRFGADLLFAHVLGEFAEEQAVFGDEHSCRWNPRTRLRRPSGATPRPRSQWRTLAPG